MNGACAFDWFAFALSVTALLLSTVVLVRQWRQSRADNVAHLIARPGGPRVSAATSAPRGGPEMIDRHWSRTMIRGWVRYLDPEGGPR